MFLPDLQSNDLTEVHQPPAKDKNEEGAKCKVPRSTFGPGSGCISQTIKKGGPRAGKTPPKPG
ncbi:hypothetical protein DSO57_1018742 [Entomophthora muscae]|uniref:Uncharacterized protein n=1 Tax=Entomophthora muscae TaxID=34485 RepID=A0ACC2RVD3_9FUNG|nr:hypothetical protein DSO57_1018742 [Entomophthora muscae]